MGKRESSREEIQSQVSGGMSRSHLGKLTGQCGESSGTLW